MTAKHLTTRFIESATTNAERDDIPDTKMRGLQLRVTKQGSKTWAIRYTRKSDGQLRRLTLGTYPAMGLEEARTRAREEFAAVSRGADPAAGVQARKHAETFRRIVEAWQREHAAANRGDRTRADDQSMLERHIFPEIGDMKAVEITKRDVLRLLSVVAAKPDARSIANRGRRKGADDLKRAHKLADHVRSARKLTHRPNRVFQLVRAIIRWAIGQDMLTADPTMGVKAPIKRERERERDLSPTEIKQMWAALERAPARRRHGKGVPRGERIVADGEIPFTRPTALAMMLALATAQRVGEVVGIKLSELDLNDTAPTWTLPSARAKNDQAHRVPLSPLAVRLIREAMTLAGGSPWLFPNPAGDGPVNAHAPTKALDRARPAIGIEDFRIHDLRRTAATRMAEMGIAPHTISLVLNHVSARKGTITGKVYVQYSYDREKRDALEKWGKRLEQIIADHAIDNVVAMRR